MADSRGFVFGPGVCFATLGTYTDGTSPAVSWPRKIDILQEMSLDFDLSIKRLFGQNIYPEAIGIGEGKVTGKIKNGRFFSGMINDTVFGLDPGVGGGGLSTGRTLIADPPEPHVAMGAAPTNGALSTVAGGTDSGSTCYVRSAWVSAYGDVGPAATETTEVKGTSDLLLVVQAPGSPPAWATGWNVYVSTTTGTETQQNITTIGLTTAWTEPTSGLIAGTALPTNTANTFTVNNSSLFTADLGLAYASSGLFLQPVASGPVQGQYSVSAGVYTLASADDGVEVLAAYAYSSVTGMTESIIQQVQGQVGVYGFRYQGQYAGRKIGLYLPNCVSSKFTLPTKQQDFILSEIDFEAFANPAGQVGYLYLAE